MPTDTERLDKLDRLSTQGCEIDDWRRMRVADKWVRLVWYSEDDEPIQRTPFCANLRDAIDAAPEPRNAD